MDDDLRQMFAPRRNKRYAHLRGFNEEAEWADTLDWRANDYDFYRLRRRILDRIDSEYREKIGLRVDQLASTEEINKMFQTCRTLYQKEEQRFKTLGVYVFLNVNVDLWLGGKACDALRSRREKARATVA